MNSQVSATAIAAANKEVEKAMESDRTPRGKRGPYKRYCLSLRAEIAKYACMHGAAAAARRFSETLGKSVSENTIKSVKKAYVEEMRNRPRDKAVDHLPPKKRGRKVMLGSEVDEKVQVYIRYVREGGGSISPKLVKQVLRASFSPQTALF